MPNTTIEPKPSVNFRRGEPPRSRARPLRIIVRLLGLVALLAVLAVGVLTLQNRAFRETVTGVVTGANPKAAFGQDAITLLVLGKDEDRDHRKRVMDTLGRSDTIILGRLDFNARRMEFLSLPRDTRVRIPGTRGYHKINAAHAIGGHEKVVETIQGLLGVTADSVVVVDYELLCRMIDDMGGVTVTVDKPLDYDDNWGDLHIHLKPGRQTLNGDQAMGFVRYRRSNDGVGDSDLVRIGRQQALLRGVKERLRDPASWVRVPRVLETVRRGMGGTLTYPQLVALAGFARTVPAENIEMHVLPSRPGRAYVYPDREKALALASRIFPVSAAAPERPAAPRQARPAPRPRSRPAPVPEAPPPADDAPVVFEEVPEEVEPEPEPLDVPEEVEPEPPPEPAPAVEVLPEPPPPADDAPI